MAKIPQGILGGLSGRVGNVVGGDWKGINYIRSMPLSVANPNTSAQQAQRGAFTQCVLVARLLLSDLIATYWDPFARAMSGYNSFIKQNISSFNTAGLDTPATFSASRGILTGVTSLSEAGDASDSEITIGWGDNSGIGDALSTDLIRLIWYNNNQDYWKTELSSAVDRSITTLVIPDTLMLEGDIIDVWVFFTRPDISKISDSQRTFITVVA